MQLTPGTKFAEYEILSSIGAGGMGEVYKARDTKLEREVAIKVLPEAFSQDKERLVRFEREARLLASLNHPNIATIHDLEESDGIRFLVMELVEGETLAERIKRGPIPVDEALPLFKQIAEGLEAAHEKGVIHRDLKPANVKITPDGGIKILDFGLAKAMVGEVAAQGLSESPTMTRGATEAGILLGTAPYMSPEQARGKAVDKRADIWAFGCCLYEALTGRVAFLGETVSDTIARVIEREPDWEQLPQTTHPSIQRLLRRCLQKDQNRRMRDVGDARIEIEETVVDPTEEKGPSVHPAIPIWQKAIPWGVAVVAVVAAVASWFDSPSAPVDIPVSSRFTLELNADQRVAMDMDELILEVSRDGKRLVWVGVGEGERLVYTRALNELEVRPISGTEGVANLGICLSPDGRWVAFIRDGALWKIPVEGGVSTKLFQSESATGIWSVAWGEDDGVVVGLANSGLVRIPGSGGDPETVTRLDREKNEVAHFRSHLLPGNRAIIFAVGIGNISDQQIEALNLKTRERNVLIKDASFAQYAPSGHLVFARDGNLFAAPFDLERLEVTGPETPVISKVQMDTLVGTVGQFSVSLTGTLVYVPGAQGFGERRLAWVDRQGRTEYLALEPGAYMAPTLSPDGTRFAICHRKGHIQHIATYDLVRNVTSQFTFEGSFHWMPVWSPDGSRIAFVSNRAGQTNLFMKAVTGDTHAVRLSESANIQETWSWSPDVDLLAYSERSATDQFDIWLLPVDDPVLKPIPFLVAEFNESHARFSPGGGWIAYVSGEEGQAEVFVREFIREAMEPGRKFKVSRDGGWQPMWSPDGRELFYRNLAGDQLLSVTIQTEPDVEIGEERTILEELKMPTPGWLGDGFSYDVAPDGDRFLMVLEEESPEIMTLVVVQNWFEELKNLVPVN